MSKISLVMPVYNAEDYLHYSIGSVLKQKYDNWELILVDDGSKDSSAKICDEYACQDSRILVIHKNNGGPSAARNIGLNMVHGQWIMFLDADDYLFDNALLILMEKVTSESVIIQFGHQDGGFNNIPKISKVKEAFLEDTVKDLVMDKNYVGYIWNKMYSQTIINSSRFNEQYRMSEDVLFNAEIFLKLGKTQKVQFLDDVLYYHSANPDSLVNHPRYFSRYMDMIKVLEDIRVLVKKINCQHLEPEIDVAIVEKAVVNISRIASQEADENKVFINDFIKAVRKYFLSFYKNSKESLSHKIYVLAMCTNIYIIKCMIFLRQLQKK